MPYLGRSPGSGVRTRFIYAATAGQTSFSGNDSNSVSLAYEDTLYMDVYQNGVLLKPVTDYAATTGTSVVLVTGATTDDVVEMIVYDTFAVADTVSAKDGGTFSGNVAMGGTLNVTGAFTSPGIDDNADAVAITIDSSERVGIGATSPSELLDVYSGSTNARIQVQTNNSSSVPAIEFRNTAAGCQIGMPANVNAMTFTTADNERMRIDSSGHVGIGTTTLTGSGTPDETDNATGIRLLSSGFIGIGRDAGICGQFNRNNAGAILGFRRAGSEVGTIGTDGSSLYIGSNVGSDSFLNFESNAITPATSTGGSRDNAIDLGKSDARFDDIFATNGTIQTSDQNEKQQIASLTDAEITAAKAISALFKTFKWNDKVEAKGDDARTHTGVIAQEVQTAMSNAGLDAADYAFWCSDTWTDDDGNSQTRMGVRYPELLAFVGAATEQRLANIESRLTALEA